MKLNFIKKLTSIVLAAVLFTVLFTVGTINISAEEDEPKELGKPSGEFIIDDLGNEIVKVNYGGAVQYAVAKKIDAKSLISLKWYPIINESMDIYVSSHIPKKSSDDFYIVLRGSKDGGITYPDLLKKDEEWEFVKLPGRPDIKSLTSILIDFYDFETGTIKNTHKTESIEFSFNSEVYWTKLDAGAEFGQKVPISRFPSGSVVSVRIPSQSGTEIKPASLPVKLKIPAQGKAPKVTEGDVLSPTSENKKTKVRALKGTTDKMELSVGNPGGSDSDANWKWEEINKKNIPISEVKTLLNESSAVNADKVTIYVRIKANGKRPASQITVLEDISLIEPEPPTT